MGDMTTLMDQVKTMNLGKSKEMESAYLVIVHTFLVTSYSPPSQSPLQISIIVRALSSVWPCIQTLTSEISESLIDSEEGIRGRMQEITNFDAKYLVLIIFITSLPKITLKVISTHESVKFHPIFFLQFESCFASTIHHRPVRFALYKLNMQDKERLFN